MKLFILIISSIFYLYAIENKDMKEMEIYIYDNSLNFQKIINEKDIELRLKYLKEKEKNENISVLNIQNNEMKKNITQDKKEIKKNTIEVRNFKTEIKKINYLEEIKIILNKNFEKNEYLYSLKKLNKIDQKYYQQIFNLLNNMIKNHNEIKLHCIFPQLFLKLENKKFIEKNFKNYVLESYREICVYPIEKENDILLFWEEIFSIE